MIRAFYPWALCGILRGMEGPSVWAIAERLSFLKGLKIEGVSGNAKVPKEELSGRVIKGVYPLGKRLIIDAGDIKAVIHFLMYGSYRIDERKEGQVPRLSLRANHHEINFYNTSLRLVSKLPEGLARSDVLSPSFDREKALRALLSCEGEVADLLLDQEVFGGVGNIIKNEALFLAGIHPQSLSRAIPPHKAEELIRHTVVFSQAFLQRRREGKRLRPILSIYRASVCPSCGSKVSRKRHGVRRRMSFFCQECQVLYK